MAIVADIYDHVIGVDTHAKTHTYAIIDTRTGQIGPSAVFPAHPNGVNRAITWISRHAPGTNLVAVEGASSYSAGLTKALRSTGVDSCDVRPPRHKDRTGNGKNDKIDAITTARSVLGKSISELTNPRREGTRNAIRVLLASRRLTQTEHTANRNALTALARTTNLSIDATGPLDDTQIRQIATWRKGRISDQTHALTRTETAHLAKHIIAATAELQTNHVNLSDLANHLAPGLQNIKAIGPITGGIILTAYPHPKRIRPETASANLASTAPIPTSSRNTVQHRLNHHKDQQLNMALNVITHTRTVHHPTTRIYIEKRTTQSKTRRENHRYLKHTTTHQTHQTHQQPNTLIT